MLPSLKLDCFFALLDEREQQKVPNKTRPLATSLLFSRSDLRYHFSVGWYYGYRLLSGIVEDGD
jgi:hypothetical protein